MLNAAPSSAPSAITICTVSYHHAAHLRLNIALAAEFNPEADIRWLIGENTPTDSALRLTPPVAPQVEVIATEGLIPERRKPQDFHTGALEFLFERVTTRFMLILDPDFYPVMPGWAEQVPAYMQHNGLALFGAPWHPKHIQKYRYFPTVHCTFVDRDAFGDRPYTVKSLRDGMRGLSLKSQYSAPGVAMPAVAQAWRKLVLGKLFPKRWKQSWAIRDTGSALFSRYWAGEMIPNECLTPVYNPTERPALEHLLDRLLPDDLSFTPKQRGSYSRGGGFLPQIPQMEDWEQFLWRGRPFGFHLRGHSKRDQRDPQAEVALVGQVVDALKNSAAAAADGDLHTLLGP